MYWNNRILLLFALILSGTIACQTVSEKTSTFSSSVVQSTQLMNVQELKERMDHKEVLHIIQVSKLENFRKKHVPGALCIYRPDFQISVEGYGGLLPSTEHMERLLSKLGIQYNEKLILYDEHGDVNAARLWWILRSLGYDQAALLNGGLAAWEQAGFPIDTGLFEWPKERTFKFPAIKKHDLYISMKDVKKVLHDPQFVILDTRSKAEYSGEIMKKGASRSGRIPGSIMVDYVEALNDHAEGDMTFKSLDQLAEIYQSKGISSDKKIIVYCHSGVRSALTTFVLKELLDYPNVFNYDGSWTEWSYFQENPIVTDYMTFEQKTQ